MPLLHGVRVTSTYKTFSAFVVFMSAETRNDYIWAIQTLKDTFPDISPPLFMTDCDDQLMHALQLIYPSSHNLLCVWHINKNLATHFKTLFGGPKWDEFLKHWNKLISISNKAIFEVEWQRFQSDYGYPSEIIEYIKSTWIEKHKERFISVWTTKYRHFRHIVSSRAEAAHHRLKTYIKNSTGNLYTVYERILVAHDAEYHEITTAIAQQRIKMGNRHKGQIFANIRYRISHFALNEVALLIDKLDEHSNDPLPPCTGEFESIMGIPCRHKIAVYRSITGEGGLLKVDDFDQQWHLKHILPPLILHHEQSSNQDLIVRIANEIPRLPAHQQIAVNLQIARALEVIDNSAIAADLGIKNPAHIKAKGRPKGASNKRTRNDISRNLSSFELAEIEMLQASSNGRKLIRCSKCKLLGFHKKSTCPKRNDDDAAPLSTTLL